MRIGTVALALGLLVPAGPVLAVESGAVDRMLADVAFLAQSQRVAGTESEWAAAEHLAGTLRNLGIEPTLTEVPLANGLVSHNVSATFGGGPVEILLGAHYDSLWPSPGADDNASGVAVLLEVARGLVSGALPVPAGTTVTIVFFGAEERLAGMGPDDQHAGSRHLAGERAFWGALPAWMLSVDMVGFAERQAAVYYRDTSPEAAEVLHACGGEPDRPLPPSSRGSLSDHQSFAVRGTLSAFLWREGNPRLHTEGETVVRPEALEASLRATKGFLACAGSPLGPAARSKAQHLQADLLWRRPDNGGLDGPVATIRAGEATPGDLGALILGSEEWRTAVAPVGRLYLAAFGRFADADGLRQWSQALRSGTSLEPIAQAFMASAEFSARFGPLDDAAFVRLLYGHVLGREPDQDGADYWASELSGGRISRPAAIVAFAESAEHVDRTAATLPVAAAYAGLLRREVDPPSLATWAGRPVDDLVDTLLASDEYAARFR